MTDAPYLEPTSLSELPADALSVRQPWAWAIIFGGKDVENRNKAPIGTSSRVGSRFTVHAAKGMTRREYEHAQSYMAKLGVRCPRPDALFYGGVIGSVLLTDVVSKWSSRWFFGPRGLVLADPLPLKLKDLKPCRGQLGWFRWQNGIDGAESGLIKPWMCAWPDSYHTVGKRERAAMADLFTGGANG